MNDSSLNEKKTAFTLKNIFYLAVAFYLVLLTWFIFNDYTQAIKKIKDDVLKTSAVTSLQVRSTFEQIRNILIIISSELSENDQTALKEENLSKYLYSRNMLISDIEYLLLADSNGHVIAASSNMPKELSLDNKLYFSEFQKLNIDQQINPYQRKSITSNEAIISFLHKTHSIRQKKSGIIEASVPLNLWYQYFKKQIIFPNDEIVIMHLNSCSILGSSSKVDNVFSSRYLSKDFCKENLKNIKKESTKSYIDNETRNAISYVILPEFKVAVVTVSSPKDFLNHFYKKNSILVVVSLTILFWFWQLINHLVAAEDKLREARIQKVHSSKMASLGEMAGGIAHEINTPLAIISMTIEQLNESIEEKNFTTEEVTDALNIIKSTSDRIAKIINGLRFFARDGSLMPMESVDINLVVEDTCSFCSEKMRLHEVKLDVIKNYQGNLFLNCRAVEISQVILNLLNNAHDAISGQQEKWIQLIITDLGEEVEINIVDSGTGIPKELQDKIMQPFFTTKEIGKGTGLGLSISRGIVESHKGKFFVDSNSKNTKFTIRLPKNS